MAEPGQQEQGEAHEAEPVDDAAAGGADILRCIGRQIKVFRNRAGLSRIELGERIGYGPDMVAAVEQGRRPPQPGFLDGADEALDAFGVLKAAKDEVVKASFPKRFRDVAGLEEQAVACHSFETQVVSGVLQTEDYARAVLGMLRPLLNEETIEQQVAARVARQSVFSRWPAPLMGFVLQEPVLHYPYGGRAVLREQLERLLEIGQMRNVEIQVMPTDREDHAGTGGPFLLLEPKGQPLVAYAEVQGEGGVITDRQKVHRIKERYGIIRAQALTPRESLKQIEKVLGET